MTSLNAKQVRAARAILEWSQDKLAEQAGLAVNTIRNMETGFVPSGKTMLAVRRALEEAGLEFIGKQGVKERAEEVIVYEGIDSAELIQDDIIQTLKREGGDLLLVLHRADLVKDALYLQKDWPEFCTRIGSHLMMGLLSETESAEDQEIAFRTISKEHLGPVSYLVYGNRHVLMLEEETSDSFRFVLFKSNSLAQRYRAHFLSLWSLASNGKEKDLPLRSVAR